MKYYSDITKHLHEKTRKIADLAAQIAELNGETTKANKPLASEKSNKDNTTPTKINGTCGNCSKCFKTDTDGDKKKKSADSGYYSSVYINLNGKEFYSEGADSWNDVKKAVRKYFEKLQGLK